MGTLRGARADVSRTLVMGIVNATPDSFYPASRRPHEEGALAQAVQMAQAGADVIDVGGESTRPGSEPVPEKVEQERVIPVVREITDRVDVPVSVDTRRASVAQAALEAGASIVNDTSAGRDDPRLLEVVAEQGADVVLMHRQGEPEVMQEDPTYDDAVAEVAGFLLRRAKAAREAGVAHDAITLDPGIGFGKRLEHNLALIRASGRLSDLGYPVLLGVSRKSMFAELLDRDVDERLPGSLAVAAWAAQRDVDILRVHDVGATLDVVRTIEALEATR